MELSHNLSLLWFSCNDPQCYDIVEQGLGNTSKPGMDWTFRAGIFLCITLRETVYWGWQCWHLTGCSHTSTTPLTSPHSHCCLLDGLDNIVDPFFLMIYLLFIDPLFVSFWWEIIVQVQCFDDIWIHQYKWGLCLGGLEYPSDTHCHYTCKLHTCLNH